VLSACVGATGQCREAIVLNAELEAEGTGDGRAMGGGGLGAMDAQAPNARKTLIGLVRRGCRDVPHVYHVQDL
jgi:hypothetical protein